VAKMAKQLVSVYVGHPIDDPTERHFLSRLRQDLEQLGIPARILANYEAGRQYLQLDFVIVTSSRVVHCELKGWSFAVVGTANGPWKQILPDGTLRLLDTNAYRQAQQGTYALSDDMKAVARRHPSLPAAPDGKFFKTIDTIACLYPAINAASRLERLPFVTAVGYRELLERLLIPGPDPKWSDAHWDAFVLDRGLYRLDERSVAERTRDAERTIVDDYRRRFLTAHSADLHERIPVAVLGDAGPVLAPEVSRKVSTEQVVVVVGQSGIGKTHLARHAAVALTNDAHVVVWLRAGEYDGNFDVLLARAMAPFTTETPGEFVRMARDTGNRVILVLDGLNQCPPALRASLLEGISALRLRLPVGVLVASQEVPELPEAMTGEVLRLLEPDVIERRDILKSYGAEEITTMSEAFVTPFDLSIAAECASELLADATRAKLMDAFIRRRSGTASLRAALARVATMMDEQLRSSLPVGVVIRTLEREPATAVAPAVIDEMLQCPLLVVSHGHISFIHEKVARCLAAEALVAQAEDGVALGRALAVPPHADLREYALGLEPDEQRLRAALTELADVDCMVAALRGELGSVGRSVASADVQSILAEAAFATVAGDLELISGDTYFDDVWQTRRSWSPGERALLSASGCTLHDGLFANEIATLLDRTDSVCLAQLEALRAAGEKAPISRIVASTYGLPRTDSTRCLPASIVIRSCQGDTHRPRSVFRGAPGAAGVLLAGGSARSWGRLFAAVLVLDPAVSEDARLLPELLKDAWTAGGYHLRLQALDMARFAANSLDEVMHAGVVAALREMETRNPLLGSSLLETLAAYGALEPSATLDQIIEQIESVVAHEDDPTYCSLAYGVVSSMFEDEGVLGPYSEAVDALSPVERVRLLVMASRGASGDGFFCDWIIREIIKTADLADSKVRGVLVSHASRFDRTSPFLQSSISTFLEALRGCAYFADTPPILHSGEEGSADLEAWRRVSELVFNLARGNAGTLDADRVRDLWDALLGEFAAAAVDVFFHINIASHMSAHGGVSSHAQLLLSYPTEVRELLEWALVHRDRLTSYFAIGHSGGRDAYIVRTLGIVGDASTQTLLRRYVLDEVLGEAAVVAVRHIETTGIELRSKALVPAEPRRQ
jgi:energy-coupling factor transporter ATP-binding protein EcfA2